MSHAIELRGVRKTFGKTVAVDDIDLDVPQGSLWGFIGPNGAGKTTTIRMIMSILFPDSGEVRVLGHRSALDAKDRIGYLPEERGVYKKMKVGAFLRYMARLKGADGPDVGRRVSEWLERVDLAGVEKKRCEELSKGMQQKVQFIAAVLHDPELLILDEPFSGLDPVNMRLLRDLFTEQHEKGKTIIFSTHVMHQAEQLCKHIVMIHEGRKVLDQPLSEIRARFDPRTIFFEPLDAEVDAARLEAVPGVARASSRSGTFELAVDESAEPREVIQRVIAQASPARIELHRPSLEDVFVEIVKGSSSREEIDAVRAALREDDAASSEHAEVGP